MTGDGLPIAVFSIHIGSCSRRMADDIHDLLDASRCHFFAPDHRNRPQHFNDRRSGLIAAPITAVDKVLLVKQVARIDREFPPLAELVTQAHIEESHARHPSRVVAVPCCCSVHRSRAAARDLVRTAICTHSL